MKIINLYEGEILSEDLEAKLRRLRGLQSIINRSATPGETPGQQSARENERENAIRLKNSIIQSLIASHDWTDRDVQDFERRNAPPPREEPRDRQREEPRGNQQRGPEYDAEHVIWFGRVKDLDTGRYEDMIWGAIKFGRLIKMFEGPKNGRLVIRTMINNPANLNLINTIKQRRYQDENYRRITMTEDYMNWILREITRD